MQQTSGHFPPKDIADWHQVTFKNWADGERCIKALQASWRYIEYWHETIVFHQHAIWFKNKKEALFYSLPYL